MVQNVQAVQIVEGGRFGIGGLAANNAKFAKV
jgi:hypothetical protein